MYPNIRMRRNRLNSWLREIISDVNLSPNDLILPIFICEGLNLREKISSMPGVCRLSIDQAIIEITLAHTLGIKAIALFPSIDGDLKTPFAEESYNKNNLICRAVRSIKSQNLDIGIICDIALDPYTDHGHDGIIINNHIDNDQTIEIITKQALALVEAGCDIIAPSEMMDGRVLKLRQALDENDYYNIPILSYAAKYASSFYGPFRDAVKSTGNLGLSDKKTYQMDFKRTKEAIMEIRLDIDEGADMIMIKPGLPYLDVIKEASLKFDIPIFAYQVSGEYAMIKFASQNNCFNYHEAMLESLYAFKRAGASAILTYAALDIAKLLK